MTEDILTVEQFRKIEELKTAVNTLIELSSTNEPLKTALDILAKHLMNS